MHRFGVCCVFAADTTGQTVTQNNTYIRNPGFPGDYTDTTAFTTTIEKCACGE